MKTLSLVFLMALALALTPLPARATILFVGGEDSDFVSLTGAGVSTTAGTFFSGYARESMGVPSAGNNTNNSPPVYYFMTPTFTASSVIWIHAAVSLLASAGNPTDWLTVYSPDGYARILLEGSSSGVGIYAKNQAGTKTLLTSANNLATGILTPLDLYVNYATSGEVTLYYNGQQVADYTGNVTTNSATTLDQVQFSGGNQNCTCYTYWSEIIVSTTQTTSMRLVTLAPAANGNTDTFDTGGVSNINETTLNQSTVNASGTSGQEQEYTVSTGSFPSGTFSVVGVFLNAQAQVDTTGPQHLQGVVRTGGSDFTSSNYAPPQSTWGLVSIPFLTNPNTGNAWATTDLTNAGFNIGFESQN